VWQLRGRLPRRPPEVRHQRQQVWQEAADVLPLQHHQVGQRAHHVHAALQVVGAPRQGQQHGHNLRA
jgi:hypothetical protein